ncbi:MAG: PAS domain S-box protein, partial [Desulfobaccales bacterium]
MEDEQCGKSRLNQILLDSLPCVALLLRPSTQEIVASNQAAIKFGAVPGTQCYATWGERDNPCPWCLAPALWKTGQAQHLEVESMGVVWDAYWAPVEPDLYLLHAFDITDRRRMEDALREAQETQKALLNAIPESIFLIGTGGAIVAANETAAKRLGKGLDELIGSKMSELLPSEVAKRRKAYSDEAIRTRRAVYFEDIRDGMYLYSLFSPIINAEGKVSKLAVFSMDITARKRAEEALQKQMAFQKVLLDNVPIPIFYKDAQGIYLGCNIAFEKCFGLSSAEAIGKTVYDMAPREFSDIYQEKDQELFEHPGTQIYEFLTKDAAGSVHNVIFRKATFSDSGGVIGGIVGAILDITERKMAENSLKENLRLRQQILDTIPSPIFYKGIDGRYQGVNQSFLQFFGKTMEQVLGKTVHEVFPKEIADKYLRMDQDLFQDPGIQVYKFDNYDAHGQKLEMSLHKATFLDKDGSIAGLAGIMIDITEQKKAETERLKFNKLESLSILAGGIAHDFNNILTAILGNIGLAMLDGKIKPQVQDRLAQAEQACLRAQALSQKLLTFANGGVPIKKIVSIANLLKELATLSLSGSKSRYEGSFPDDLWSVEADTAQLNQVIANLLINADQAMPEGEIIKITAENISVNAKSNLPISKGKYVKFAIADQGIGISPEYLDKIFDPYFSTKQKGSGLGLATAYSIIKYHSGHIQVESRMGVGTTFYIYLPAADKRVPADELETVKPTMGQGKVLVM